MRCDKTRIGYGHRLLYQMQPNPHQEVVPRDFLGACHILLKKPSQVRVTNRFGCLPYAVGLGKELCPFRAF